MSEEGALVDVAEEQVAVAPEAVETPPQEAEQQEEKPKEPEIPKGVQKRIDRAVRQKYEAEARAKMLEERLSTLEQRQYQPPPQRQPADDGEPTIDKFDNFDQYVAAKAAWIAERKINETLTARERAQMAEREAAERAKTADSWNKRIAQATAEMPDFEDVIASSDVPMTAAMQQAIMESDVGPRLAYHLANNPDEAYRIAQMSPTSAIRALGRIEAQLESGKTTTKTVSSAPEPVKTVGGRATAKVDPDKLSPEEWVKWRRDQIRKNA